MIPRVLAALAAALLLLACGQAPAAATLPPSGFGTIPFRARDGHELTALVYRARSFEAPTGPIWFVLHGASRDAERYVRAAAPVAERYGALAVVPDFTKQAYPKGDDYTLNPVLYGEIERLFDTVRGSLEGRQPGYFLFGHSAGAQFAHRLLTFVPDARAKGAVAANAGWYTLPSSREAMPYGLRGAPSAPNLRHLFATPVVVLLGERDTTTADEDELVRGTPQARAQGATRLARGRFYFAAAKEAAREIGAEFDWRLEVVPRAPHDAGRMLPSAGFLLFAPGEEPCSASAAGDASGLSIGEVVADPPADTNGDGTRDAQDDEVVEILNRGTSPVCLTGWALGDAAERERHVFPLGRALAPGGKLLVFGGGVPTGRFGGATVQWSASGLSLTNGGDVLTLRDRSDTIVRQVSWGDCAGAPCATDHRRSLR